MMKATIRRIGVSLLVCIAFLGATATPASAHAVNGVGATNYESVILSVKPSVPGLQIRLIESANRAELTNNTGKEVIVYGYQDEPYLRLNNSGVYENLESPATYQNRTRLGTNAVPDDLKPDGPPRWKKISSGNTARWHDHRIHWMSPEKPDIVKNEPNKHHVIIANSPLPVSVGDTKVVATFRVSWVPGPSPVVWIVGVLLLAAAVAALLIRKQTKTWMLPAAVFGILVCDIVYRIGIIAHFKSGILEILDKDTDVLVISQIAWIGLLVSGILAIKKNKDAPFYALLSVAAVLVASIVPDLSVLWLTVVPSVFSPAISRLLISIELGLAAGLIVGIVWTGAQARRKADGQPDRKKKTATQQA